MITLAVMGGAFSTALGTAALTQVVQSPGPGFNYAGLAALIASIAGLISAIGAIIIGTQRKRSDPTEVALELLLKEHERQNREQEQEQQSKPRRKTPRHRDPDV